LERYIRFVLGHRALVVAVVGIVSAFSLFSVSQAVIASSLVRLFFGENPKYVEYRALADQFGGNDVLVIAYADEALLTREGIERLERITAAVARHSEVLRADSLTTSSRIRRSGDDLVVERWGEVFGRTATAAGDDLIDGLFLGRDRASTAVIIELTYDPARSMENLPGIQDSIVGAFTKEGIPRERIHLAGLIAETVEVTVQTERTLAWIFPIMVVVLIGMVYLLFFRLWPVVLTVSISLLSVLFTFGFATAIEPDINILMTMIPGIMLIVGFSDVIHMYNAYTFGLAAGGEERTALVKSCAEVGSASAFTAATEFVGFVSLAFVPTPVFRQAGLLLGFGVASTLALVLTLVPVILSWLPRSALFPNRTRKDYAGPILDGIAETTLRVSTTHPWRVLAAFAVVVAVAVAGNAKLTIDTDFTARLAPSNHIQVAQRFLRDRFASPTYIDVYLTAEGEGAILEPRVLEGAARLAAALEGRVAGVDQTLSLVDLLRRMDEVMTGGPDPFATGAMTRERAAQYLILFEASGGTGLERMIDGSRERMKMMLRVSTGAMREISAIGLEAERLGKEILPPEVTVMATGVHFILGDWLTYIVEGQRDGLVFSILTTLLMMIVVLRSFRVGVASMIPNFLPLFFLGGYLGLTRDKVDSDTLVVASIAMGIAVDDTIHFLSRLKHELAADPDLQRALARTTASTGRAIIQAAAVLCVGFSPFALSDYQPLHALGTLLPMTLIVALVCELLLMPALITIGLARFGSVTDR
jgi:hypothetical protein